MSAPYITKGSRVRSTWLQAKPFGTFSLAGHQMKAAVESVVIVGTCRHFRGDDPTNPTAVRVYVEPEGDVPDIVPRTRPYGCECEGHDRLVEINPDWIIEVLP
jgi:hypothetical protein